jgi:hypothetical protein
MRDIHVTKVVIKKPYEIVWKWLSDPLTYPNIYPFWLSEIKEVGDNLYGGTGPYGEYKFTLEINQKLGSINLKIGNESSRTRLFQLDDENTVVIHLAVRWKDMKNHLSWFFYKRGVNKDFKNAKKIIEKCK